MNNLLTVGSAWVCIDEDSEYLGQKCTILYANVDSGCNGDGDIELLYANGLKHYGKVRRFVPGMTHRLITLHAEESAYTPLEFSDEKIIGTVTIVQNITEEDFSNLIVGAFEGGTSSWMGLIRKTEQFADKPKDEPVSTWVTKLLLEGQGIEVCDIEDRSTRWTLTLPMVLLGIAKNAKERPEHTDMEYWDADDYDCIIQYALFDELVYG